MTTKPQHADYLALAYVLSKHPDKLAELREAVIGMPDSYTRREALAEFEAAVRRDAINITAT